MMLPPLEFGTKRFPPLERNSEINTGVHGSWFYCKATILRLSIFMKILRVKYIDFVLHNF